MLWLALLAVLAIVLGAVFTATNDYILESRNCEIASGRVFTRLLLIFLVCYVVVLFSSVNTLCNVFGVITVFVCGFYLGFCAAILFSAGGVLGFLNFFFVYLPVFLLSLFLLIVALVLVGTTQAAPCNRNMFLEQTKRVGVLAALNLFVLVIFIFVVGSLFGVLSV